MPTEGPPLWKRILRRLGQVVGGLAAVVIVLILIAVAINARDEDLSPEAKALLVPPPNPFPDKDNLYVALMGFDAPADQTPLQLGAARIKYYNDTIDARLRHPDFGNDGPLASPPGVLKFQGNTGPCRLLQESVWGLARQQQSDIAADWATNRILMDRYRQLRNLTGYYETERPSVLMHFFAVPPSDVRCLFLKKVALDLQSGKAEQVRQGIEDLTADLTMHRKIMSGDGALISKMIGAAFIHAGLILLSDAVADPTVDITAIAAQEPALFESAPIASWRIGSVFTNEMRFADSVFQTTGIKRGSLFDKTDDATVWQRMGAQVESLFFKPDVTTNISAELAVNLQKVADGDPSTFSARRAAFERWTAEQSKLSIRWVSNPSGKSMTWMVLPAYLDYPARVYDVAAFQRLVCLAYQIRQQKIGREAVAAFMQQHLELSRHPIDNQAFEWDAKSGTISVKTVGPRPAERRFRVKVAG